MALADRLGPYAPRLAYAHQVHGDHLLEHGPGWLGWLRGPAADGHLSTHAPTAMAVTLADCVPVFIGHPSGAAALLHSGWKGTAAGLTRTAIRRFGALGLPAHELRLHCGPAICGRCYEVGPDVYHALTGVAVSGPACVDLRALIVAHASAEGVRSTDISRRCTRCDNERFFSHRAGDAGRQLGVLVSHADLARR
jgi:hypothetical protein